LKCIFIILPKKKKNLIRDKPYTVSYIQLDAQLSQNIFMVTVK